MNEFFKVALAIMLFSSVYAEEKISYNFEIRPILSDKCFFCHGPDIKNNKAKLRLDTEEGAFRALKKGRHPIVKGSPEKSEIWKRMITDDEDDLMPPPDSNLSLSDNEKALIKKWIEQGAEYEGHWAFEALQSQIKVPEMLNAGANPVDHFVYNKLKSVNLSPSPKAAKELLLRRASFVLTGLPPSVEKLKAFMADKSPNAYEKAIDALLESKACAEKLTVDWMDLSRFADTYGFQVDRPRDMTPWRDWVLKAFNSNMPYDKFITWQLAGDLIPNPTRDSILATAFNRNHQQKVEGGSIEEEFRVEYVADRTHTAGTAFLGLTFECCRCHDHKYDPISMKDYYSLYAFFNNIDEAGLYSFFSSSTPTPALALSTKQQAKLVENLRNEISLKSKELDKLFSSEKSAFDKWRKSSEPMTIAGQLAKYEFNSTKTALKNTLGDEFHGSGQAKIVKDEGRDVLNLDGDSQIRFKKLGPYTRANPISLNLSLKIPDHKERAVIIHRSKAWTDAASKGWEVLIEDGQISWAFIHFWPGNAIRIKTLEKAPLKKWFNLTVTYDGSSKAGGLKIYFDGVEQKYEMVRDSLTKTINYGKGDIPVTIGARMRDRGFKNGLIDKFSFFDRELTSAEVLHINKQTVNEDALYEYFLNNHSKAYMAKLKEIESCRLKLNKQLDGLKEIMVMKELPVKRKTYVLKRGLYSEPDYKQLVVPNPPEEILPFPKDFPRNRLGLAKWLTMPEHPLTSRVAVNRLWQMVFGEGIVNTPDDFGSQGALPTHPQLLNWLSREFVDSGWNIKHILKIMVTSETFKQSSIASEEKLKKDSYNQWLSFGPRRRLSAEMIRDAALSASGLLSNKFGGASESVGNSMSRGLYLYWKRNEPPADMLIFDAPRRQVCSVKRETTSTPLQALVLLNKDLYIKTSKGLADRTLQKTKGDVESGLNEMFMALTSRMPDSKEMAILKDVLAEQNKYFSADKNREKDFFSKNTPAIQWKDKTELAAWSVVANLIMNMDSSIILR